MRIDLSNRGDGTFELSLDDARYLLDGQELKSLLLQITQIMAPGSEVARDATMRNRRFLERLKVGEDVDLQTFILAADHEDVVVLLKASEDEAEVRDKLLKTMSDNLRKIFLEDVDFRFKDDVPAVQVASALDRLSRLADELREEDRTDL